MWGRSLYGSVSFLIHCKNHRRLWTADGSPRHVLHIFTAKDVFPGDGHCFCSSNGKWMLTDCYPHEDHCRKLFLYNLADGSAYEIGSFYSDPSYPIPTRCDLHPDRSRDDRQVCIDSICEDLRQMYIIDVSELTRSGKR